MLWFFFFLWVFVFRFFYYIFGCKFYLLEIDVFVVFGGLDVINYRQGIYYIVHRYIDTITQRLVHYFIPALNVLNDIFSVSICAEAYFFMYTEVKYNPGAKDILSALSNKRMWHLYFECKQTWILLHDKHFSLFRWSEINSPMCYVWTCYYILFKLK